MNLTTKYMGLKLKNPIVPSASPLSKNIDSVKRLEDAGAAAIVTYSLFEEQITHEAHELDYFLTRGTESYPEAISYFPDIEDYNAGPDDYLRHISRLKESVHIPVIGSLNGVSAGGWTKYAKLIEQAGADGIELNVYYIPTDTAMPGYEVENMYINVLRSVKDSVNIPVAIKLSPYFSSFANMAKRFDEAGADALVMFNRFYQPDFDLENLEIVPHLMLSSNWEMRMPLRWIAILYRKIHASMAATSGIHSAEDVIKVIMAGGDAAMMCSDLLRNGPIRITEILSDLMAWMAEREYESLAQMKGSMSQKSVREPAAFERANYMKVLNSYQE